MLSTTRFASVLVLLTFSAVVVGSQTFAVTLLGTGCPRPVIDRFGPSILVEAGDQKLIFDVGRGAIQRLGQAKVPYQKVDAVFLTHLHSDHIVGLPDLWLTGWIAERRDRPLLLFGPRGTERMMSKLEEAFDFDIRIRLYDDRSPPEGVLVFAKDVAEGIVYEKGGVRVTAFEVDHAPVKPAFGFRIDFDGRSIVLSGDTKPSENLVKYAKNVDVLIHEVATEESLRKLGRPSEWVNTILAHHTTPEQAGDIFTRTKPRLAVFSHFVLPSVNVEQLKTDTKRKYSGPVEVGEDLMKIKIGKTVTVQRFSTDRAPDR